jgi:hypothetical protein
MSKVKGRTGYNTTAKFKPHWRPTEGSPHVHCYTKRKCGVYASLCGRYSMMWVDDFCRVKRPPLASRCKVCDAREVKMLGKQGSLPPSPELE